MAESEGEQSECLDNNSEKMLNEEEETNTLTKNELTERIINSMKGLLGQCRAWNPDNRPSCEELIKEASRCKSLLSQHSPLICVCVCVFFSFFWIVGPTG